jgi:predicted nuclease of predicted toxin-antitoxin system
LPDETLIDMNLSPGWVAVSNEAGFASVHWTEIGPVDAPDQVIMRFASENDFVVLTHDLDFGAMLAATHGEKPSVVQIRANDITPAAIGDKVIAALRQLAPDLEAGALSTIDPKRDRVRLLPLLKRDKAI